MILIFWKIIRDVLLYWKEGDLKVVEGFKIPPLRGAPSLLKPGTVKRGKKL
jgi:hypothetical protein